MKPGRIIAIVVAAIIALPSLALLIGGAVLGVAYGIERSDDGYFDKTLDRLTTATPAITAGEVDLRSDPGPPEWLLDAGDVTVRFQVIGVDPSSDLFIGIGPADDVSAYLSGVAYDEIRNVDADGDVEYRTVGGTATAEPPGSQSFWVASVTGTGPRELTWDLTSGEWTAVLMNSDGSAGLLADVTVGVKSGAILAIAFGMLAVGLVLLVVTVVLIVVAARRPAPEVPEGVVPVEPPVPAAVPAAVARQPAGPEPVRLEARIDEPLSPWMWLVKWFMAIPHWIVLAFLWAAFAVVTVIAGFAILFTGRYPRGMFDFNVGVLRWTWRVSYYAASGGMGTDRYPPFSLDALPDYPATLDIEYPERLSQGLVLVKWWLLAIPHYVVVALIAGAGWWAGAWAGGLLGLLVLIAVVTLLFTGAYPPALFDLIVGLNRWGYRVLAYAALMTDRYPPFRLDQGGAEPGADDSM